MKKFMLIFGIAVLAAASSFADFQDVVNWFKGPRKDIRSIVITSNYIKSRLLADLIQAESRQPYVLLPAEGQKNIYFCPVNKKQPAFLLTEKNVARFINFSNPERVYVLGGTDYVPQRYIDQIDRRIQVIMIPVKDWDAAARSLSDMMDLPNLSGDFSKLNQQVNRGFYNPGKYPAPPTPPPVQEEETAIDQIPVPPAVFDNSPQTKLVVPVEPEPAVTPELKQPPVMPKDAAKAAAPAKAETAKAAPADKAETEAEAE